MIPKFIEIAFNCLIKKKVKTAPFKLHLVELVLNCIYYNPRLTLSLLEQIQWTNKFFELWFQQVDHLPRVHDKKLSILTLCTLLELPLDQLPPSLASVWPHLFDGLLKIFATYGDAEAERKRMETGDYEDEDDFDYDEHGFVDTGDEDEEICIAGIQSVGLSAG